jgi:outer membrane protein assembly factor BamB
MIILKKTRYLLLYSLLLMISCQRSIIKSDDFNPQSVLYWGGNEGRSGQDSEEIVPPLKLAWTHRANAAIGKAICAADSFLFFGDKGGDITILHHRTGKTIRNLRIQKRMGATCLPDGHRLVIALRWGKETLRSINMNTGKKLWALRLGGIEGEPILAGDTLFAANSEGFVFALESATGAMLWKRNLNGTIMSSFAKSGDRLVLTTVDGMVWSLSASLGEPLWNRSLSGAVYAAPVIFQNKIFIGTQSRVFYCLDGATGQIVWQTPCEGGIFEMAAVNSDEVYFGTSQGLMYCLDSRLGTIRWSLETNSVIGTSPLISGNYLFFGTLDKKLYAVDRQTSEEVWSFITKGRIRTTPVSWNGMLVAASENHFIYGFVQEK